MAGATKAPAKAQPGQYFGWPGITRWTEQPELNDNTTTVGSATGTTPLTGQVPFRQTDIAFGWRYSAQSVWAITSNTDTLNVSEYAPFNVIQTFQINITNLYNLVDVQSMYDLFMFNSYRSYFGNKAANVISGLYTTTAADLGSPGGGFGSTDQANIVTTNAGGVGTAFGTGTTTQRSSVYVPSCIFLDEYVDLDQNGNILGIAHRVPVSPLYMSGTARDVTPQMTVAAFIGTSNDASPLTTQASGTGSHATCTNTITHRWQRVGMYGTRNAAEMPQVFNWRYALASRRFNLGAISQVDIPLKQVVPNGGGGQLMSVFFRFFDPNAGTGNTGRPIAISDSNFTDGKLQYGSSLYRFFDTVQQMQQRVFEQHGMILPDGVWLWDMGVDYNGRQTNALALNLYTTDVVAHFDFAATLSSSSYVVVGTEVLTYVLDQPITA